MPEARLQPDVQRYLLAVTRPDPRFAERWKRWASAGAVTREGWRVWRRTGRGRRQRKGALQPDWYLQPESAGPVLPGRVEVGVPEWWANSAWPVRVRQMANAGQYRQAVEAMTARYGISLAWPGAAEEGVTAEAEVWRRQAARAAADGKWKEAWMALERYVRHTRQTEWP